MNRYYNDVILPLKQNAYGDPSLEELFQYIWKDAHNNNMFLSETELYRVAWMLANEIDAKYWLFQFREMLDRELNKIGSVTQHTIAMLIIESLVLTKVIAWEK
jgi:hypothetical protein